MTRALAYLQRNALSVTALVCSLLALAGASYAAFKVPPGSVGEHQIKNHAIDPVKLNHGLIGGYVRAWASVDAGGRLLYSSRKATVRVLTPGIVLGSYEIIWHTRPKTHCTAIASVDSIVLNKGLAGYAEADTGGSSVQGQETGVLTYNSQGQHAALPFNVALIC